MVPSWSDGISLNFSHGPTLKTFLVFSSLTRLVPALSHCVVEGWKKMWYGEVLLASYPQPFYSPVDVKRVLKLSLIKVSCSSFVGTAGGAGGATGVTETGGGAGLGSG